MERENLRLLAPAFSTDDPHQFVYEQHTLEARGRDVNSKHVLPCFLNIYVMHVQEKNNYYIFEKKTEIN